MYNLILSYGFDSTLCLTVYWLIPGVLLLAILARISPSGRIDLPDGFAARGQAGSLAHNAKVN